MMMRCCWLKGQADQKAELLEVQVLGIGLEGRMTVALV